MSAHTPGEWRVVDGQGQYAWEVHTSGPRGGNIVIARVPGSPNNRYANARLIAAAPDQHALLVEATDLVPRISGDDPMAPALADWCRKVRAAITKATGDAA